MSYIILWIYDVAPEHDRAFSVAYGPGGDWAKLFARADGFDAVELYRAGARWLTIDRWRTEADFAAFQVAFAEDYAALNVRLAPLSRAQELLGAFDAP